MRIFAVFDDRGLPQGFYTDEVHGDRIPTGAVEISQDDWMEFLDYQGQRRWEDGKVVEHVPDAQPVAPPPEMVATMQAIGREHAATREGIAAAVMAWSGLENGLALLLGGIVDQGGGSLGMTIYFVPSATETRIAIVQEALAHFLAAHPDGAAVQPLLKRLMDRIARCKKTRNSIVHGNVVTVAERGRQRVRLTAPIFDLGTGNRDAERMRRNAEMLMAGDTRTQLPGISASDVQQAAENFGRLTMATNALRLVVSQMRRTSPDPAAFQRKLTALEAALSDG